MKLFVKFALRAVGWLALLAACFFVLVSVAIFFDSRHATDTEAVIGLSGLGVVLFAVGWFLRDLSRRVDEIPLTVVFKALAGLVLRLLALVVVIGGIAAVTFIFTSASGVDNLETRVFGALLCGTAIFGGAYLLFFAADRLREHPPPDPACPLWEKIGFVLTLVIVWLITLGMPLTGRIIFAVVLFLAFTRIHQAWASHRFRTWHGSATWADIFDRTAGNAVLCFILAGFMMLTGGRAGILLGGGGSSGGGGASGRW